MGHASTFWLSRSMAAVVASMMSVAFWMPAAASFAIWIAAASFARFSRYWTPTAITRADSSVRCSQGVWLEVPLSAVFMT